MDLLSIIRSLWRHKLVAAPVVFFTVLGAFYVVAVKAPVYQASASLLLLSPPGPPTQQQIAANHKLAKINTNNPYVNYGDMAVVADAVINILSSNASAQALVNEGVSPNYTATLSTDFGTPPIIEITGTGHTAESAIQGANLVTSAAQADLYQMQKNQGVNPLYMITSTELVKPTSAQTASSGKLRTLIAVLAVGALLLFIVVSLTDAVERRRREPLADGDIDAVRGRRPRGSAEADVPQTRARGDRRGAALIPPDGARPQEGQYSERR
jgi:capsular polysaccharide biosynthesis protein